MPGPRSQKLQKATELWLTMPTAKLTDFVVAFKNMHGETISGPGAYIAKRRAGLGRMNKKSKRKADMTIERLKQVQQLAKDMGGIAAVRKQLKSLEPLAVAAGGFDQIGAAFDLIEELKRK